MPKTVSIIGTGTIGAPLISMFNRYKDQFGVDEVIFFKNTPLSHDISNVKQFIAGGAKLATDQNKVSKFHSLGVDVSYTREEAVRKANVIIDCTPNAEKGKDLYKELQRSGQLFLAQGSAHAWGIPYARNINEYAVNKNDTFVKIVSCNTHALSRLYQVLESVGYPQSIDFLCIRRSNDISQNGGMVPGIHVDSGPSHHAQDVIKLLKTEDPFLTCKISSSSCKIASQYMHTVYFSAVIKNEGTPNSDHMRARIFRALKKDPMVTTTEHATSNKIFSFGRDHGHYGRILTQTVVNLPSIHVEYEAPIHKITGFAFTPQDGNSLLSSISAAVWHLSGHDWKEVDKRLECLEPFMFQEI